MNRLKGAVLAAALACAYAGTAAADETTGFYAGVGIGQSTIEDDGFVDFDEDDTGFKLFGGYQFNKYIAAELAYVDFGSPDVSSNDLKFEEEAMQLNASVVGTLPINEYFGVLGRVGLAYVEGEAQVTAPGITFFEDDDNSTDISYGLGVWVAPTKNFLLRLEYEMTSADLGDSSDDVDLSLLSLSAVYKFGK